MKLFFYSPILTNNNLYLKFIVKYCKNIIVTFNYNFLFFIIIIPSFLVSIRFFSPFFFFFFSLDLSPPHTFPHPHSSHLSFYFSRLFLLRQIVLCFYFSFFISISLFLILFLSYSHIVTHITGGEQS